MAAIAPLEAALPQTKLCSILSPPPGLSLPDGFTPPPGLQIPFGCLDVGHSQMKNAIETGAAENDSDNEGTSVGTGSFPDAGSSEHDTEPEETTEESQMNASAPCFVPGKAHGAGWRQDYTVGDDLQAPLQPGLVAEAGKRTPLRSGAGLFVPGASGLPFMPMAEVEETWQRWYEKSGHWNDTDGAAKGAKAKKKKGAFSKMENRRNKATFQ